MPARSKRRHKVFSSHKKCIIAPRGWVFRSKRSLLLPPLLCEDFAGDGEYPLEALATLGRVLAEPVNGDLLDAVLDLLPAAAHGDDFGRLVEGRLAWGVGGGVADGLLHGQKLAPGQVLGAHGNGLFARVDVGDFVDEAGFVGSEEGLEPSGQSLFACDEAFGAKLWRNVSVNLMVGINYECNSQFRSRGQASGSVHPLR